MKARIVDALTGVAPDEWVDASEVAQLMDLPDGRSVAQHLYFLCCEGGPVRDRIAAGAGYHLEYQLSRAVPPPATSDA